jgi:hypothetical protein
LTLYFLILNIIKNNLKFFIPFYANFENFEKQEIQEYKNIIYKKFKYLRFLSFNISLDASFLILKIQRIF